LAGYVFLCAYFDPSTSTGMVNGTLNMVIYFLSLVILFICALVIIWKGPKKWTYILGGSALWTLAGTICIPRLFEQTAASFMVFGIASLCIAALVLLFTGTMTWLRGIMLIIAAGFVMRIGYGMSMPVFVGGHDYGIGSTLENSDGHAAYIAFIVENHALPSIGDLPGQSLAQFYNPPLHHIICALVYIVQNHLGFSYLRYAESLQFLVATYSCLFLLVWYKLFRQLGLKKLGLLIPVLVLAFHPSGWIIGNCLNNDMLTWLLVSLCLLYLVKWYREPGIKNILIMAFSLGLAMMTKLSAVTVAPVIAVVFLYKIIKKDAAAPLQETWLDRFKRLIGQFAAFAVVSIPLGIWHSVRSLIKFGQPLGYVPALSQESAQYIGDIPFLKRLFYFDFNVLFSSPFVSWYEGGDYSVFGKILKTSLFIEWAATWEHSYGLILPYALTIVNYLLVAFSLAAIVYVVMKLRKRRAERGPFLMAALYFFILIGSQIIFAYQYPHQCTNDIRYILPCICIGLLFIGKMCQLTSANKRPKPGCGHGVVRISAPAAVTLVLSVLFSVCSMTIYILNAFNWTF